MSLKSDSKNDYKGVLSPPDLEQLRTGCLMRIADAAELMAKNYQQLVNDVNYWRSRCDREREFTARLQGQLRATRGVVTKLKAKLQQGESNANANN